MEVMRFLPAALAVLLLAGCTAVEPTVGAPTPVAPSPTPTVTPEPVAMQPGTVTVIAEGLEAPWSIVRLRSGSTLISERDSGRIMELTDNGELRLVGTVPDVVVGTENGSLGEGGLLGLAYARSGDWLFAYYTSETDNRVVRYDLEGEAGGYSLGASVDILTGLAKARNHNGGRIKLGPDGLLYVTVGDAANPWTAQDLTTYNGKILRVELDGSVPRDNPFPGSLIYSLGHRNPQGLAWDLEGQLWASELGQDTWDEFNRIVPGGNYGWPAAEGVAGDPAFIDPVAQWPTSDASPSGLTFTGGSFFMAALRGQRLWSINLGEPAAVSDWFVGQYGRLRDVVPGPNGTIWVLTNNTDGRGTPSPGDDKLLEISLVPVE